jgi:hypothetical protein
MKSHLILAFLLLAIAILFFTGVNYNLLNVPSIYLLPIIQLIVYFIWIKIWKVNRNKLLIMLHFLVVFSGLFSYVLYRLFINKDQKVGINNHKEFTQVSNLMFNSENVLYFMIYLGIFTFLIDFIYLIRMLPDKKP